uniref:TIMELESS-interacting protein n=1 Tax=Callorhinchus milii TaxID=7868 RepID=V9KR52_CALMI
MAEPFETGLFDIPDYDQLEDETFPPLPPPSSPGQIEGNSDEEAGRAKDQDPPVVVRKGVKRPQPKLDAHRLTSERGLPALRTMFNNVRFKGKGHETEDLKTLLQHMEHWAHRLYPKLQFDEFVDQVESLGSKKEVQTCLKRIRLNLPITHDDFISKEEVKETDDLQIDSDLENSFSVRPSQEAAEPAPSPSVLSEEQRLRMERNKQLALERRQAKLHSANQTPRNDLGHSQPATQSMELNKVKIVESPHVFDGVDVENLESLKERTETVDSSERDQEPECPAIEEDLTMETLDASTEVTEETDSSKSIQESKTETAEISNISLERATKVENVTTGTLTEPTDALKPMLEQESTKEVD